MPGRLHSVEALRRPALSRLQAGGPAGRAGQPARAPAWTELVGGGSFAGRWADLELDAGRGGLLGKMGIRIGAGYSGREVQVTAHTAQGRHRP